VNKPATARVVQSLTNAPTRLLEQPFIGEKLEEFEPRELRRILVGHYEIHYLYIATVARARRSVAMPYLH